MLQTCRASNPTVTPSDIESSTQKIADEFTTMGIDLKTALKGKVRKLDNHAALGFLHQFLLHIISKPPEHARATLQHFTCCSPSHVA